VWCREENLSKIGSSTALARGASGRGTRSLCESLLVDGGLQILLPADSLLQQQHAGFLRRAIVACHRAGLDQSFAGALTLGAREVITTGAFLAMAS